MAVCCAALAGCFAAPPQIVSLSPARGAGGVAADAPVVVTFDHRIDIRTLRGRLSVQPGITGCDLGRALLAMPGERCVVRSLEGANGFRLDHPGAIFEPDREYSFRLAGGVADDAGVANSIDHSWGFTTASAPSVRATEPEDGAQAVPLDSMLTVTFTQSMRESSAAAAIRLQPQVEGTQIWRNSRDHARFVVQPGRLLQPGTTYTLSVAAGATDEHGQHLSRMTAARFRAGGLRPGPQALILARRPGEAVSVVQMTPMNPPTPGDHVSAVRLLQAPRCGGDSCGVLRRGEPLTGYLSADLSPDGRRLAVVERDLTSTSQGSNLRVLDLLDGSAVANVPGGGAPAWSPDGRLLEFTDGAEIRFLSNSGDQLSLPPGLRPNGRAVWAPDGASVILPVSEGDGTPGLELANPLLRARYPLPVAGGPAGDPALSPKGRLLALRRPPGHDPAHAEVVNLEGAGTRSLLGDLRPLGFTDEATLLALRSPGSPSAEVVQVALASGDLATVNLAPGADPATVILSATRHTLGFVATARPAGAEAWVETARGAERRQISALSDDGLVAATLSLN